MKRAEMNAIVEAELAVFDRGIRGSAQRLFGAVYQMRRMNSLGKTPERPGETSNDVREWATAYVRRVADLTFIPLSHNEGRVT